MYYFSVFMSPVGKIILAGSENKISGLWFEGQKHCGSSILKNSVRNDNLSVLHDAREWLRKYFSKEKPSILDLPIAPEGSVFRHIVWKALCEIPYGNVVSYGEIAKITASKMNKPNMCGRAIGGAVSHNPISIIIPCHRVIGSNGRLTGYAGGIQRKISLLEHEGVDVSGFI